MSNSVNDKFNYEVHKYIRQYTGPMPIDLNHFDLTGVDSLYNLFAYEPHDVDVSQWEVSKITSFRNIFAHSKFTGDLSQWDIYASVKNYNDLMYGYGLDMPTCVSSVVKTMGFRDTYEGWVGKYAYHKAGSDCKFGKVITKPEELLKIKMKEYLND